MTARVALTEPASDVAESNGVGADVSVPVWEQQRAAQFLPDRSAFSEQHRIRGYEVRPDQRTTIVTIANLLQVRSAGRRVHALEAPLPATLFLSVPSPDTAASTHQR